MIKKKKILSLIIAREGSKGLKNKNILKLKKKPLVQWTIEASKKSKYIDYTLVSSNSKKVVKLAKKLNVNAPFIRPKNLSTKNSTGGEVIKHAVKWLRKNEKIKFDFLILLQPTSPLRTSNHIDSAIRYYFSKSRSYNETLVSVSKLPQKMGWILKKNKEYIRFIFEKLYKRKNIHRQNLDNYFLPNGAIFFCNLKNFKETFYTNKTMAFEMDSEISVDIDSMNDFKRAENLILKKLKR